jgi:hypothetical protein
MSEESILRLTDLFKEESYEELEGILIKTLLSSSEINELVFVWIKECLIHRKGKLIIVIIRAFNEYLRKVKNQISEKKQIEQFFLIICDVLEVATERELLENILVLLESYSLYHITIFKTKFSDVIDILVGIKNI